MSSPSAMFPEEFIDEPLVRLKPEFGGDPAPFVRKRTVEEMRERHDAKYYNRQCVICDFPETLSRTEGARALHESDHFVCRECRNTYSRISRAFRPKFGMFGWIGESGAMFRIVHALMFAIEVEINCTLSDIRKGTKGKRPWQMEWSKAKREKMVIQRP